MHSKLFREDFSDEHKTATSAFLPLIKKFHKKRAVQLDVKQGSKQIKIQFDTFIPLILIQPEQQGRSKLLR